MESLILFRRHSAECKAALVKSNVKRKNPIAARDFKDCKCPVWRDGRENGQRILRSMGTTDWDRAERKLAANPSEPVASTKDHKSVEDAIEDFLADCRLRLAESSTSTYANTLYALRKFLHDQGVISMNQITLDWLGKFRQQRKGMDGGKPKLNSQRKDLQFIRTFLKFCVKRKWLAENYAMDLSRPRDTDPPTRPFEDDEVKRIIEACDTIDRNVNGGIKSTRIRARALALTLLYSGLRISDVAILERSKLNVATRKLLLRTMKGNKPVYLRLHPDAVAALVDLPVVNKRYFFWTGETQVRTIIHNLFRSLKRLLKHAGLEDAHPHQFRDTFAKGLLDRDTPIRTVQILLGHASVKTTELHYGSYVMSQQRLLDEATDRLDFGSSVSSLTDVAAKRRLGDSQSNVLAFTA